MSTQAYIKFKTMDRRYKQLTYDKMLWLMHDAYPENIIKAIKMMDYERYNVLDVITLFIDVKQHLTNVGFNYTIDDTLCQNMEYMYTFEIHENTCDGMSHLYLKVEEEHIIDNTSEEYEVLNPRGEDYFVGSEMRTIKVIKLL